MNTLEDKILLKIRQFFALLKALESQVEHFSRNRKALLKKKKGDKS
jgi:hypothetical protein